MISQSETPAQEEIEVRKHQRYIAIYKSSLSSATVETGLVGGTRVDVTPKKYITNKKKNLKPRLCLNLFL